MAGWRVWTSFALAALATGCDDGVPESRDGGMDAGDVMRVPTCPEDAATDAMCCPANWVAYARGGCGPAVLLCIPDGGAAPGACDGIDLSRPPVVRDEDGAESVGFYRLPDGRIGGAWSTPWPCPPGWRQEREGTCAPTLRDDCPVNTAPLPDGTCTDTGYARCGDGWPEVPEEARGERVVYVRERASRTPDGTRDAPYPGLMEAIEANPGVRWFLLAPGLYRDPLLVTGELHLVGVCAAGVRLTTPASSTATAFTARGLAARLDLRSLTVTDARVALALFDGASATLRSVVVARAQEEAITAVDRASIEIHESLLDSGGRILDLRREARVSVASSAMRSGSPAIQTRDGPSVELRNVSAEALGGALLLMDYGGRGTLRAVSVRNSAPTVIGVIHDARGRIEDVSIRDLRPVGPDDSGTAAVAAIAGGQLTVRRLSLRRVSQRALVAQDATSVLDAEDVVVGSVRGTDLGLGVEVINAEARLRRVVIEDAVQVGLMCQQVSRCDARNVLVRGVAPQIDGTLGVGIATMFGAELMLRRAVIEGAALAGLSAASLPPRIAALLPLEQIFGRPVDPIARVTTSDVIVRANAPRDGNAAFGVVTAAAGAITARRVAIDDARGVGFGSSEIGYPTRALAEGLVRTGRIGASEVNGLVALLGPTLNARSSLTARDVYVRGLTPWWYGYAPDTPDLSPPLRAAIGAYAGTNSGLSLEDFVIDGAGSADHGALAFGSLALSRGVVVGHRGCAVTASSDAAGRVVREGVREVANAREGVCVDDALPDLRVVVGRE